MSLPLGETFRDFRLDKNLSLSQAAGDIVSKSFLSKFERGDSAISFAKLLALLQRMNVTLNEFLYRAHGYMWTESEAFFHELSQAASERDVAKIDVLIRQAERRYQETALPSDRINTITARAFKYTVVDKALPKVDVDDVLDYLFRSEDWLSYDIQVIRFILIFVPASMRLQIARALMKHASDYVKTGVNQDSVAEILLNIFALMIRDRQFHNVQVMFELLTKDLTVQATMTASIHLYALKSAYWFVSGRHQEGRQELQWVFDTLHHMGKERLGKQLGQQWNDLTGQHIEYPAL